MPPTSWIRPPPRERALLASALLLTLLALPAPTHAASETTGRVAGWIYDPTGVALSQVSVSLSGPTVPQPLRGTTDDSGRYELDDVPVGDGYVLELTVPGVVPIQQKGIKVLAGQTTPVDITLQVLTESGASATYRIVEQVNPVLNPDSAQRAVTLEADRVERIPTVHQAANLPQMLPGVGPGLQPSTLGGLTRYSRFFVDGLETTDITTGGLFMPLNFDAVQDFEILIGAMDAQYNALGVVVNAVTKDGTNDFRWDVSLTASPSFLNARPHYPPNAPVSFGDLTGSSYPTAFASSYLPSISLSGPLVKDKLWIFGTLQVTDNNRDNPIQLPGQPPTTRPNSTLTTTGHIKLTWQPTAADRLSFTLNGERNGVKNQIGTSLVSNEAETQIVRNELWFLVDYDHRFSEDVLFQLQTGLTYKGAASGPAVTGDTDISHTDLANNLTQFNAGRLGPTTPGNFLHEDKWKIQFDPTLSWRFKGLGSHQMKAGLQLAYAVDLQSTGVLGNERFVDQGGVCNPGDPSTFSSCFQRVDFYNLNGEQAPLDTRGSAATLGSFLQDRWTVNRQLTLILGLRFDYGQLRGQSRPVADLTGFGPRASATYDVFADRKTLLVAHYGRSNDVSSVFIAQHANPTLEQVTSTFNKAAGAFPTCSPSGGTPGCSVAGGPTGNSVLPGQTAPHVDELAAGLHRELYAQTVLGLDFTWRRYSNLWADQEVNRIWDDSGTVLLGYRDGISHTIVQTSTPASAQRRYTGVDLWVQGTPGNWDLFAGYTLAYTWGTVSDYSDGYLLNPRFAQYYGGPLPEDYRHTLKGWVSYRFAWGLDVGARFQYRTGHPQWEGFPNPADTLGQRAYRSPRGTGFAPNPGTGQPDFNNPGSIAELRTQAQFQLDVQARYDLARLLGLRQQRLELVGLVQNVLNDTTPTGLNDLYAANGKNFGNALTHLPTLQAQVQLRWRN